MIALVPAVLLATLVAGPAPRAASSGGDVVGEWIDRAATVADLVVRYGTTIALRHVDLTLHAGEVLAVMGRNGAGKSSLLGALTGSVTPTSGTVRVGDAAPDLAPLQDRIAKLEAAPKTPDNGAALETLETRLGDLEACFVIRSARGTIQKCSPAGIFITCFLVGVLHLDIERLCGYPVVCRADIQPQRDRDRRF